MRLNGLSAAAALIVVGAVAAIGLTAEGAPPPPWTVKVYLVTPKPTSTPKPTPVPTPTPSPTPSPFLQYGALPGQAATKRYIAVMAVASDAPTSTKLATEVSGALHQGRIVNENAFSVVAMPGLASPNDVVTACAAPGQSLAGAIILYAASATSNDSYLLAARNWSHIDAEAIVIRCTGRPFGPVAQVVWSDNDITGTGTRWSVNLLPIATIASAIASLNSKSSKDTTATTYSFASPVPTAAPGHPFPASGTVTNEVDKSNTNTNNSALVDLAVLGSLSPINSGGLNVGGGTNDALFKAAAAHLAHAFVGDFVDGIKLKYAVCDPGWFTVPVPAVSCN